jgi:hypothetical protein
MIIVRAGSQNDARMFSQPPSSGAARTAGTLMTSGLSARQESRSGVHINLETYAHADGGNTSPGRSYDKMHENSMLAV